MASYATIADIETALGFDANYLNTESIPTLARAERELDQVTKDIDFYLNAGGITTQPTDTNILARLRNLCVNGVACKLGMSAFGNNEGVDDSQPGYYCTEYKDGIKEIVDKPALYGAVTGDEVTYLSSQVLDGTTTIAEQNAKIPTNFEV